MLNPIDTAAVIRDGGATGSFPGQIHEGVAWWVGACFVAVQATPRLAVGHDGHSTSAEFTRRLCNGAINAQHHACAVSSLGTVTGKVLRAFLQVVRPMPGAYVSTEPAPDGTVIVRIQLYDEDGDQLQEDTGLADIRRMIAEGHIPLPVSDSARGTIRYLDPTDTEGTT